jgi:hypothetical protein
MLAADRLAFIPQGLPIIHASAIGFWSASAALQAKPREAEVLAGFAKEEAAKIKSSSMSSAAWTTVSAASCTD